MKNKKGFTLIEVISVIVIMGVIMIIAIPAVAKYIDNSNKASYAADVLAFIETARGEYEMKEYGDFLNPDEIMIVPINHLSLEKGDGNSPFGPFDFEKSYIYIVPERNGFEFYGTVVDESGIGVVSEISNNLNKDAIKEELSEEIIPWESYKNKNVSFSHNSNHYTMCEIRDIETPEKTIEDTIIVLCKR